MTIWPELAQKLRAVVGEDAVGLDYPLGPLTTYRVGGAAALHVAVADVDQLDRVAAILAVRPVAVLVVGRGSNLLVSDSGFDGVALTLENGLARCSIEGVEVRSGGAASLPVVARQTVSAGLTGFEWAVGVPGSIGGAVRMNAGGHGSDMAAVVTAAELCDLALGGRREVRAGALEFGYRTSAVKASEVVVSATLALARGDRGEGEAVLADIVRWRRENQPGGQNAGSVFTNPEGDSAGRLIDAAGCKGMRIGSASVSTKHANFIQADPGGRAADVRALMDAVAEQVRQHTGIGLEPETRLVGFHDAGDEGASR